MLRLGGVLKTSGGRTVSLSLVQVTDTSSGQKSLMHRCRVHSSFNKGHNGSQSMNITLGGVPVSTNITYIFKHVYPLYRGEWDEAYGRCGFNSDLTLILNISIKLHISSEKDIYYF